MSDLATNEREDDRIKCDSCREPIKKGELIYVGKRNIGIFCVGCRDIAKSWEGEENE